MRIHNVGVLSLANVLGLLYGLLGLIFGAIFTVVSLLGAGFGMMMEGGLHDGTGMGWIGSLFGIAAIVLLPLFYGVMGWVTGAVTAFLYNLVAARVGGIEVDIR